MIALVAACCIGWVVFTNVLFLGLRWVERARA